MANSDGGSTFVLGFLVGGIVGAVVGIMLTPKSGADARADLLGRSESWRTRAEEMAGLLRQRVGPTVDTARERIGPAVDSVRERVGPVVQQMGSRLGRSNVASEHSPLESDSSVNGGTGQPIEERG
jgi:gas vesicle protein